MGQEAPSRSSGTLCSPTCKSSRGSNCNRGFASRRCSQRLLASPIGRVERKTFPLLGHLTLQFNRLVSRFTNALPGKVFSLMVTNKSSSPGKSHPQDLPEQDVNLSVNPFLFSSRRANPQLPEHKTFSFRRAIRLSQWSACQRRRANRLTLRRTQYTIE